MTLKMCKDCTSYTPHVDGAQCAHPDVNEKYPPFLVDGTMRACVALRTDNSNPCGLIGKLFKRADSDTLKDRNQKYFRPDRA